MCVSHRVRSCAPVAFQSGGMQGACGMWHVLVVLLAESRTYGIGEVPAGVGLLYSDHVCLCAAACIHTVATAAA